MLENTKNKVSILVKSTLPLVAHNTINTVAECLNIQWLPVLQMAPHDRGAGHLGEPKQMQSKGWREDVICNLSTAVL